MKYIDLMVHMPVVEAFGETELPLALGMRLGMRVSRLRDLLDRLERERKKRLEVLADKDSDGKAVIVDGKYGGVSEEMFKTEWEALLDNEVEVDLPKPLTEEQFKGVETLQPKVAAALEALGLLSLEGLDN
jgi:hypothetical protein